MILDPRFEGVTAEAVRVQVKTERGEWMTLLEIPHWGTDEETGERVECPYWPAAIAGVNYWLVQNAAVLGA